MTSNIYTFTTTVITGELLKWLTILKQIVHGLNKCLMAQIGISIRKMTSEGEGPWNMCEN